MCHAKEFVCFFLITEGESLSGLIRAIIESALSSGELFTLGANTEEDYLGQGQWWSPGDQLGKLCYQMHDEELNCRAIPLGIEE